MKSAHRHDLETNVLAIRLENFIERAKPYIPKVIGGFVALVALMMIWSYISGSSSARRDEAWDTFNYAVVAQPMNMDLLHQAADAFPGTEMQALADLTWADGQAMAAANAYIANRPIANKSLEQAGTAYQKVLSTSHDERLAGRAHLGLARVYEMQNELDKARAEYGKVTGPFAAYAKEQAERLAKPEAKEAYDWLATAEPPRPKAPVGPGMPGHKLDFAPGELNLPAGAGANSSATGNTQSAADVFNKLLEETQQNTKPEGDRYQAEPPPASDATPATPPTGDAAPASDSTDEKSSK